MSQRRRSSTLGDRLLYLFCFALLLLAVANKLNRYRDHISHASEQSLVPRQALYETTEKPPLNDHGKQADFMWWFLPATIKVMEPHLSEKGELAITPGITVKNDGSAGLLSAARGESESIQLVLYSDQEITGLPVRYLPAGTNPLPPAWVNLYRVLTVATPCVAKWGFPESKPDRRCAAYPDPLLPLQGALGLNPGEFNIIWLSIAVPGDAPSGEYTGEISLGEVRAPLQLKVWPFTIPGVPSLRTAFGLGGKGLAAQHRVALYSDEYQEIYRRYYDALLDYRINAYHPPYGGGGAGGSLLDPRAGPYLEDERVRDFIGYYHRDSARMAAVWDYLDQLGVSQKGWIFNLDEPLKEKHYETIAKQALYLETVIPEIPYGVTFYTGPSWDEPASPFDHLSSAVDRWIVQTNYFMQGQGREKSFLSQLHQAHDSGDEIWLYVALAPREPFCNLLLTMQRCSTGSYHGSATAPGLSAAFYTGRPPTGRRPPTPSLIRQQSRSMTPIFMATVPSSTPALNTGSTVR